jgi:hypothetical protein
MRIPGAQIVPRLRGRAHYSRRSRVLVRLWKARRYFISSFFLFLFLENTAANEGARTPSESTAVCAFSKAGSIVALCSKCIRALTF